MKTDGVVRRVGVMAMAVLMTASVTGCASLSQTERGAGIGAAAGAAVGAVVGSRTGSTARGAIIGAAVGATAGAVIGREMDAQADALEAELEGAKVERVGEGLQLTFDSGIFFGFDSAELQSEARQNLDVLVRNLQTYPGYNVVIVGHTDSRGRAEYNQRLSERRAQAAGNYLISRGIEARRIDTIGMGMTEPVASNDTDAGRAMNRRVEIAIFASEAYRRELEQREGTR